ncbi:MAG: uracil-DNA glycosylase [Deltaproteobacteria bacterium]|nr:uracil-DNA glycosylase [Deltaproteobacteria bacterium]
MGNDMTRSSGGRGEPRQELATLVRSLGDYLQDQAKVGLEWVSWERADAMGPRQETLAEVRADLGECKRCRLHTTRRHIVYGEGSPSARVVIVGEGPGEDEDVQGRPFVGAAGRLLDAIIAAAGWGRQELYICNVIKCRPPRNRDPQEDETDACGAFVKRQIRAIRPRAILAVGNVAARFLLAADTPISGLRGRVHDFEGIPVVPTYHPAYLLRNPVQKRRVWQDIEMLLQVVGGSSGG